MEAIVTFAISAVLIVLFLAFKVWELKRKKKVFPRMRKKADSLILTASEKGSRSLGDAYQHLSIQKAAKVSVEHSARAVAFTAQKIESGAQQLAEKVSRTNGVHRETNSNFLREVTSHKNNLDTDRIKRETSLTDADEVPEKE